MSEDDIRKIRIKEVGYMNSGGFVSATMPNKYIRTIFGKSPIGDHAVGMLNIDVYDVILAFEVLCPARQHAIKKLLCSGIRGQKTALDDLLEAKQSIERAIEIAQYENPK